MAAYRKTLDATANTTHILESLLHIHHNRYLGIDRDREAACRRLARHAALARRAADGSGLSAQARPRQAATGDVRRPRARLRLAR